MKHAHTSPAFWGWFESVRQSLAHRADTFEQTLKHLDSLEHPPVIVETGCFRRRDNWTGDGCSTLIWDKYAEYRPGTTVKSVDADAAAVALCRISVSHAWIVHGDSVEFLRSLALSKDSRPIDLLYLDSFDLDCSNPLPSASHHLAELHAAMPLITPETWVVVDDARMNGRCPDGKARLVGEYAANVGAKCVFQDYQCGWSGMHQR